MTSDIRAAIRQIQSFDPIEWTQIPDLGLYMDQVITIISRMYQPLFGEDMQRCLSSSMINNYVKSKLIPRPTGKKYSREQIALLIMIVALKQVCSMEDIRAMLILREGDTVEALYSAFCGRFSRVLRELPDDHADSASAALDFAIQASGYAAGCAAALRASPEPVQ